MHSAACSRLILLRHGKSAWDSPSPNDHGRPLAKRGRKSARAVGRWLREIGWEPDEVFCSDARRATETLRYLDVGASAVIEPTLYLGGPHEIAGSLTRASAPTVMVIGHNPGLEAAVEVLTGYEAVLKTGDAALLVAELDRGFELQEILRSRAVLAGTLESAAARVESP